MVIPGVRWCHNPLVSLCGSRRCDLPVVWEAGTSAILVGDGTTVHHTPSLPGPGTRGAHEAGAKAAIHLPKKHTNTEVRQYYLKKNHHSDLLNIGLFSVT